MNLAPGDTIGGYCIVRQLGSGGMGVVYEVEHLNLGVRYALKAFARDHGDVEALRRRFRAEGRALARLRHPNILRVYDFGEDSGRGLMYFVMDLFTDADGEARTLADVEPGEADERQLAIWYAQLKSSLEYIHSQGVVHRDFKPGNILLDAQGNAIICDFGISRFTDDGLRTQLGAETTVEIDRDDSRTVMGSVMYLAPEVRRGEKATPAADAYALGVTFYRLLTGMWYEPGPVADGLLAEFGDGWQLALKRLLSEDPASRLPIPPVAVTGACRKRRWTLYLACAATAVAIAAGAAVAFFALRGRPAISAAVEDAVPDPAAPEQHPQVYTFDQFFPLHILKK